MLFKFAGTATPQDISIDSDNIQIKQVYDDSFKLDATKNTITVNNLKLQGKLKVDNNIVVKGNVDTVDITALAQDIVITGEDEAINHDGKNYKIKSVTGTVDLGGTKTFSSTLKVNNDIKTGIKNAKRTPLISTDNGATFAEFSSTSGSLIMLKNSKTQTISGNLDLGAGKLKIDGDLKTGTLSSVALDTLFNKYEYDAGGSSHNLKTAFDFKGSLTVQKLESTNVRGQNFDNFVADAIKLTGNTG